MRPGTARRPRPVPRRHKTGPPRRQTRLQLESPARCPSPYTPPQSVSPEESGPEAGSQGSVSSPSRSKGWCKGRGAAEGSFLVPSPTSSISHSPPPLALGTPILESSYTWVKPKARLSKSPKQGLTRVSVRLVGPSPVGEWRKGPLYRKDCGEEKGKREGKEGSKAAAPGPGSVRWRWRLGMGGNVKTRARAATNEVLTSRGPLSPLQRPRGSPVSGVLVR